MFGPPDEEGKCSKFHVCVPCFSFFESRVVERVGRTEEEASDTKTPVEDDNTFYVIARNSPLSTMWIGKHGPFDSEKEAREQVVRGVGGDFILRVQRVAGVGGRVEEHTPVARWNEHYGDWRLP